MSGHYRAATAVPSGRPKRRRQRLQLDGRSRIEEVEDNQMLGSHTEPTFRRVKQCISSTSSIGSLTPTKVEDVVDLCRSPTHAVVEVIDCSIDSDSNGDEEAGCAFPCVSIPNTERTRLQCSRRKTPFTRNLERHSHGQSRALSEAGGSIRESRLY